MKRLLLLLSISFSVSLFAQNTNPPFWQDIQKFKKQDSIQSPPANAILFIGSSSFTRWTDIQNYFPGYSIINRGFGGSILPDLIRYEQDVIFKYKPRQIVIYCGENDIASSEKVTGEIVVQRFKQLFTDIRARLPGVPVVFVSLKPSPSRWHLKEKSIKANNLIEKYLNKQKHAKFVSVWKPMLGPDGKPRPELFVEDNLHMNAKGYAIWQKIASATFIKMMNGVGYSTQNVEQCFAVQVCDATEVEQNYN